MTALVVGIVAGIVLAIAARSLLVWVLLRRLRHGVDRLAKGDVQPLLSGYHEDAVLLFHEGAHRWSGDHIGRAAIERFLQEFVAAGIVGEIRALWIGGPPWAMTMVVRFDDRATMNGEVVYANRTVLWVRTRWGRIVEQRDFYEDTQRVIDLDRRLPSPSSRA